MPRRHSHKRMGKRMGGGGASEYGTALYGSAGQHQAGEGNLIAINKGVAMGGGMKMGGLPGAMDPKMRYQIAVDAFKHNKNRDTLSNVEEALNKLPDDERIKAGKDVEMYKKEISGGKKFGFNLMTMPKMFMRMTRSRKHRRKSKRHHGKSRKHRK